MPAHRYVGTEDEELAISLLRAGEDIENVRVMLGYKTKKSVRDMLLRHGLELERECRYNLVPVGRKVRNNRRL